MLFFWTIYLSKNPEKNQAAQLLKFLEQKISILEWFLKDHVTLKTGVHKNKPKIQNWKEYIFKIY